MKYPCILVFAFMAAISVDACAQQSVGQLLAQGVKKLTGAELRAELEGSEFVLYVSHVGVDIRTQYRAGGVTWGSARTVIRDFHFPFVGSWKIAGEDGRVCGMTGIFGTQDPYCSYFYKGKDQYYVSSMVAPGMDQNSASYLKLRKY